MAETRVCSSLQALLSPRSVAVVGVSSRADSLSGRLLANLRDRGFDGAIIPVNPKATTIQGLPCRPSVKAIPEQVDLAVIMLPRDAVPAAVEECVQAGVGGLVVITAGFREGGEAGAELERRLVARVREAGIPLIGPNCMGIINTDSSVSLDATFSPVAALPGGVAFASHSGALGVAVLETAREVGLGFSQFVSLGNSADVNVCDLLEVWERHEGTRAIVLYLESLDEPRRFLELARRITPRKPIVAMKAGRTAAGQRAASSHTGALAAADSAVDAVLRQAGVVRVETLEEMFDLARAFAAEPLPHGRRIAIVTNAGGPAIAASDALEARGLCLATLGEGTRAALRASLPAEAAVGNPVDMLPSATPENFRQAVELALGDDGVDAVLTVTVTPIVVGPAEIAHGVAAGATGASKPVLSVFMSGASFYAESRSIAGLPPVFHYPEAAVRALGGLARHAERAARPSQPPVVGRASEWLAGHAPRPPGHLAPEGAFALLEEAGIPVAPWRVVVDAAQIIDNALEIGFPVVLKAFGDTIVHKTELGAVAVGLRDADELRRATVEMESRLTKAGIRPSGFLVQRMIGGGRETILGILREPQVGPLVMCGLGGVAVEALRDVSFRPAPISLADAEEMIDELRGKTLLGGFRGRPPADRDALARVLTALAGLAAANPEIAECDLNPLVVLDDGQGCIAVDVRIRIGE